MATILSRIIRYGLKNFWRNGWVSTATVAIMTLALLVVAGLILFNVITNQSIAILEDKIDISAYFKTSTPEDEILSIKESLESLSEVKRVDYISADQSLEIFKEAHKDDPNVTQAIAEASPDFLEPSLTIKAHDPSQYGAIAGYLESPNLAQYLSKVSYAENQVVIDRLNNIITTVNRIGFGLTVLLSLIAGLVVFNTIYLAIYSGREEIGVMRVVGASNVLVRGPYVIEGIIAGVLSALLSLLIAFPFVQFVSPHLQRFIQGLDLAGYFYRNFLTLFGYQLLFGIGIGALSSFLAVRRYLKN